MNESTLINNALSIIIELEQIIENIKTKKFNNTPKFKRIIFNQAELHIKQYRNIQLSALKYLGIEGYKENFLCYDNKIKHIRNKFISIHNNYFNNFKKISMV